jgi:hypothetical protein
VSNHAYPSAEFDTQKRCKKYLIIKKYSDAGEKVIYEVHIVDSFSGA